MTFTVNGSSAFFVYLTPTYFAIIFRLYTSILSTSWLSISKVFDKSLKTSESGEESFESRMSNSIDGQGAIVSVELTRLVERGCNMASL